ncbi:GNAT family N-acetyltransferase [Salipaludibacillus daqingensis]|uniref:GNAT family N-acetyltransferase n=1 Tax=Salipaludibacillus daqingensis TaxID=3041001 RepID=UPI002474B6A4|nr:GNAT family protein [Salipaludibacillus daqingensis]
MIKLIPFTRDHFSYLKYWLNDTSPAFLMKWGGVTFQFPLTDEQLHSYITNVNEKNNEAFLFTVIKKNSCRPIGHVALRKIDHIHHSARIGKLLIGEEQDKKQGFTPIILDQILHFAFETLQLHRISLGVFETNPHAHKIYRRYGFKDEGFFRDFRLVDSEYWGMYEMSLLQDEWQQKQVNCSFE